MSIIMKHFSEVSEGMTLLDRGEIEEVVRVLRIVKAGFGTVYLFGNGGSHATASHMANDLNKMARIRSVCVGDLVPVVTAYGNDDGWKRMFSSHLEHVVKVGDGVIGISCSGTSMNVIYGLQAGIGAGALGIGLTGLGNDSEINSCGLSALVHVRVPDIRAQEDVHLMVAHAIVRELQEAE